MPLTVSVCGVPRSGEEGDRVTGADAGCLGDLDGHEDAGAVGGTGGDVDVVLGAVAEEEPCLAHRAGGGADRERIPEDAGGDGFAQADGCGGLVDRAVEFGGALDPTVGGGLPLGERRRVQGGAERPRGEPVLLLFPGSLLGAGDHQRRGHERCGEDGHQDGQPHGLSEQRDQADAEPAQHRSPWPSHEHR